VDLVLLTVKVISLVTIASFSVAIPFLTGLIVYRRIPSAGRWLTWLMAAWLAIETVAYTLRIEGKNNWLVYMILSFFEIIIVTMFYQSIFQNEKAKTVCTVLAWAGLFLVVGEYSMVQSPENTIAILYECAFFFGMGLYAFYEMTLMQTSLKFKFVNLVTMFFFLGSAVYYASWKFMEKDTFMLAITAHAYLLIICYGLFTYGIWKLRG
jgi:hypothetical protein